MKLGRKHQIGREARWCTHEGEEEGGIEGSAFPSRFSDGGDGRRTGPDRPGWFGAGRGARTIAKPRNAPDEAGTGRGGGGSEPVAAGLAGQGRRKPTSDGNLDRPENRWRDGAVGRNPRVQPRDQGLEQTLWSTTHTGRTGHECRRGLAGHGVLEDSSGGISALIRSQIVKRSRCDQLTSQPS